MPELPEVETVVRSLKPYLLGRQIVSLKICRSKSFPNTDKKTLILRQKITNVHRRAKIIIIDFANHCHLVTHLKMTGQLLYQAADNKLAGGGHPTKDFRDLPGKHTRVIYTLDDDSHLYFNDMRLFGWQKIWDGDQLQQELKDFGPDANNITNQQEVIAKLKRCRRPIKQAIMDNKILCGIGNIYAAEICFACGINPLTPASQLNDEQLSALLKTAPKILNYAIEFGGTTFDGRYVDANGKGGNFEEKLLVYGREDQPCTRCGTKLQNVKIGGRSTVFCPHCQHL